MIPHLENPKIWLHVRGYGRNTGLLNDMKLSQETCVRTWLCHVSCKNEEHSQQWGCLHQNCLHHAGGVTAKGPRRTLWITSTESSVSLSGRKKGSSLRDSGKIRSWWWFRQFILSAQSTGPPLLDAICGCSLPHQGLYPGECVSCSNPKFLR